MVNWVLPQKYDACNVSANDYQLLGAKIAKKSTKIYRKLL
jgi:hypothetical protein